MPGACIDRYGSTRSIFLLQRSDLHLASYTRVNMYASTWICTKVQNLFGEKGSESPVLELAKSPGGTLRTRSSSGGSRMEELEI